MQRDLWLVLIGAGIGVASTSWGVFLAYLLVNRRENKRVGTEFKAAFAQVKHALEDGGFRPELLSATTAREDQAIATFGSYITIRQRAGFNDAAQAYRHCRRTVVANGGLGQVTDKAELVRAVEKLLAYAN
jgi:hypothetical protein